VRVGCKLLTGSVAVTNGVPDAVSVPTIFGVTLGTGSISCTWRVAMPFLATGVPRSENVSRINPRLMRGITTLTGSAE
jgi:hypothetical protein